MSQSALRRGVTLLEIIVSLLLIATVILVSITASANLLRNQVTARDAIHGHDLAFQILDEVTAVSFQDMGDSPVFGRETDETASNRSDFDDVDDYHNYVSTPPTHRDGAAMADFAGWSFHVAVTPAQPTTGGVAALTDTDAPLRLVTVTYVSPSGVTGAAGMVVSNLPHDLPAGTPYERWRKLTLTFPNQREIVVSVPLRNAPEPAIQ